MYSTRPTRYRPCGGLLTWFACVCGLSLCTSRFRIPSNSLRYDRILADVPCSGDGTLRKTPSIWKQWVPQGGLVLQSLQFSLAMHAVSLLKVCACVYVCVCVRVRMCVCVCVCVCVVDATWQFPALLVWLCAPFFLGSSLHALLVSVLRLFCFFVGLVR